MAYSIVLTHLMKLFYTVCFKHLLLSVLYIVSNFCRDPNSSKVFHPTFPNKKISVLFPKPVTPCYTMLHHATPLRNLGFFNPLTQPATAPHDKIHPGARLDIVSTMAPAAQMEHRTTHLSQAPGKSGKYRPWMIDEYNIIYT